MSENQKRILQMLADGKISVEEAQGLLSLTGPDKSSDANSNGGSKFAVKFLRVVVEPKAGALERKHGRVNVRVPFALIRAGIKLATLIPPEAADKVNNAMKEKGMSFDMRNLKPEDLEDIITALRESEINVDTDDETVKVYAE
jgi:hypothetical protein